MTNTLFYGDNLDVLRRRIRDETVDLCYIDPPFNSKRNYFQIYNNIGKEDVAQAQAFTDTWTWNAQADAGLREIITNFEGRYTRQTIELIKGLQLVLGNGGLLAYVVSMTQRVNEIWRVLKPTGSFYLHCDPTASHYLKLLLDSVFCPRGGDFVNEIIWCYGSGGASVQHYSKKHDILFFYPKGKRWTFNVDDIREPYSSPHKSMTPKIVGGKSYVKMNPLGRIPFDWWQVPILTNSAKERLGYPTQKPEALLERIIQASSNEGDTTLDAYCGCGTTVAVAQRLRRNWIGIDITYQSIAVILKRLEEHFGTETTDAIVLDGIPRDMESARALANKKDDRTRKEFEKWALLTYSRNRATVHEKKGADKGIDGMLYFLTGSDTTERMVFQVKSGKVQRNDIATLNSDRLREKAELAVLITLEEPTKAMHEEVVAAGRYTHALMGREISRLHIVTIDEMIRDNRRIDIPLGLDVLKSARAARTETQRDLGL